jgi:hypothetical protein
MLSQTTKKSKQLEGLGSKQGDVVCEYPLPERPVNTLHKSTANCRAIATTAPLGGGKSHPCQGVAAGFDAVASPR